MMGKMTSRTLGWLTALLSVATTTGCPGETADATTDTRSALVVEAIEIRSEARYSVREIYAGRVASPRSSDLGFDRPGRVVALHTDEGDHVDKGELLGALETRDLRAEMRELRARKAASSARLELAKLTTQRRQTLLRSESISEQNYDEARFNEVALEADLEAAKAGIARLRIALELSELRSPFAGHVVMRSVDEGTVVTPGQAVFRVIEEGAMELRVGIPLATAERLEDGTVYSVEIEGEPFSARMDTRIPTVDAETRTVTTILQITNDDPTKAVRLRDGALGRLELETTREGQGYWLPTSALSEGRRGLWSAFAIEPDSETSELFRVERRDLQVIHVETNRVFVSGTLHDGDQIVASGVHRIVPGQRVRTTTSQARRPATLNGSSDRTSDQTSKEVTKNEG